MISIPLRAGGSVRIVLVDDAPEVRTLIRTRLRLTGSFDVVGEGATGADAVRLAEEHRPELLLLDVSMPDMDGLDALVLLRERAPEVRVVMFSGFEEHGLADRARELGAVDFVEKSTPIEVLADRLLAVLAGGPTALAPGAGPPRPEPILQEHLERFRTAFERAAIGMATLTLTGRLARANRALDGMAGVGEGDLVGLLYTDLAEPPRRQAVQAAIAEVASGARDAVTVDHQLRGRSVSSTIAVVRGSGDAPLYLFLQAQDVSVRRAAEEELRRSQEQFRLLVEGVGDYAIFMLDPTGHIVSWNLGAQRAKGYSAEEILGKHFSVFYLPDAVERRHPEYELEVASSEGRYEEEGWRVRKDGTTFWANVVITALRDADGELAGFAKVTRDVTERRRLLDDLETAAAERTQLLAVTAHELRTPVAVVRGFAATLAEHWADFDDDERQEMVRSLARTGDRLSRLVEDLFTAARLESGAVEVRPTAFDLAEAAAQVARELVPEGVELDLRPVAVCADRGRVQQMIANYLTNAVRYGAQPVRVSITAGGNEAELRVSDAGPGVAEELVPKLFGKFAAGAAQEATGLGLFIVRELARAQGGEAWYEPGRDHGAVFGFRLPLAP